MDGLDGNTITNVLAILAMTLGLYYFLSRQITAVEKRLREDMSDLRDEITASETRLRDEIKTSETRLRDEIKASEVRLEKSVEATNRRIDDTNAEIRILINDVGVVKGALGVSTQSREREPVATE